MKISGRITKQDVQTAMEMAVFGGFHPPVKLLVFFGIVAAILGFVLFTAISTIVGLLFGLIGFLSFWLVLFDYNLIKSKREMIGETYQLEIDSHGILSVTEHEEHFFKWSSVRKIRLGKKIAVFSMGNGTIVFFHIEEKGQELVQEIKANYHGEIKKAP